MKNFENKLFIFLIKELFNFPHSWIMNVIEYDGPRGNKYIIKNIQYDILLEKTLKEIIIYNIAIGNDNYSGLKFYGIKNFLLWLNVWILIVKQKIIKKKEQKIIKKINNNVVAQEILKNINIITIETLQKHNEGKNNK